MKRSTCFVLWSCLLAMVGCQSAPHPMPGMAGVRIKVLAEPKAGAPTPDSNDYVSSAGGTGAFETVDYSALNDIVVWAEPSGVTSAAPASPTVVDIDAQHPSAVPHAVSVGQTVMIRNHGTRLISVYSVSDGNDFDIGNLPPNVQAEYTIRSPGLIEILANALSEPIAVMYAAPTRWVALGRSDSTVNFNDLPPGPCRVSAWHPRLPASTAEVNLAIDQFSETTVHVGVNGLPKVMAKKR